MLIDLHHNKIVDSLITANFERCVSDALIPKLVLKHGESLFGIQMYEDYISDKLLLDGEWYYPLTLMTDTGALTEWISWRVDKKHFVDGVPYAYTGDMSLDFKIIENPPAAFVEKIAGRARFAESGLIKVIPSATSPDPAFLSGKCSQTFLDELARQIGAAIGKFTSVSGLADSSISISVAFAPGTYMEHTSESVTYRRLLLSDGSSMPRDLWVKWTRLDGKGAFTVADHPSAREILFELGEDVPRKICEKEYRFLLAKGKDGYHKAMGRKNITEWREIIKRAVRRGELMKIEDMNEISEETRALDAMLAEVLGVDPDKKSEPVAEELEFSEGETDGEDEFSLAMRFVRETALAGGAEEPAAEEAEAEESDELEEFYKENDEEAPYVDNSHDDEDELLLLTEMARAALTDNQREAEAETLISFGAEAEEDLNESEEVLDEEDFDDEETLEDTEYIDGDDEACEAEPTVIVPIDPTAEEYEEDELLSLDGCDEDESEVLREQDMLEPDEEISVDPTVPAPAAKEPISDRERQAELEERIRREVETRLRLEYETEARKRAEEEAERLRREQAELRREIEKMREAQRIAAEERERELAERRLEEEKLRATIEQQLRSEAKEKERLAEAARLALEEQRRLEDERARVEAMRLEEEKAAERRREEERIEAERRAEAERIRREAEERAVAKEAHEPETEVITPESDKRYTYVSKTVRLRFRRSVDPNITTRIYEIIKATIEYYGKEKVYLRIKASVPDTETVRLDFVEIPLEEMELLSNIIKVLGNSGLGIAKAIVE